MENLWIVILIAVVTNIIGAVGKANQKKKPMPSSANKTKQPEQNYKKTRVTPEANENYGRKTGYGSITAKQGEDYSQGVSGWHTVEEEQLVMTQTVLPVENDHMTEMEGVFDLGLPELQSAVVMAEILNKPLALRKKR